MLSNIELLCRVDCRHPMPACQQDGVNPEEKLERFLTSVALKRKTVMRNKSKTTFYLVHPLDDQSIGGRRRG